MAAVQSFFQGKKTYLVTAAMVLYAAAMWWDGSMTADAAVQLILNGLGLGTLRAGVAKV